MKDAELCKDMTNTLDKCSSTYDRFMVLGDLNHDILCETKSKPLCGIMELFDLSNLIEHPTCFKKDCKPSLLDVILTNAKTNCIRPQNFATGVSDCHNLIGTLINVNVPKFEKRKIQYRSFRTLDANALNNDLQKVDLLSCLDENEICNIDAADFWSTIKPYLSKRSTQGQSKIILNEDNTAISNDTEVAETFNNFFVNVAEDIG